ncbi:MAG: hypothetical protein A2840_00295 [Candidatus Buchananbacteria bacterium RIFCSPHIGHO2_01_FULL_47_11b]|uniref:DUF4012 domain-containing protein n=1 Tax=Candidatus Buchananbacteria bacterium RIFCSPHIGHO2_01_FULL_47_11b TaxID=1797537 RepID=A0A1G1Y4C2_9BACT|nr:MAG: hypothetical protein A2840_00295 [Candidatus Buchananbacteria bacterium RIFCSPHIGHO2_01_FULL_47_11b]
MPTKKRQTKKNTSAVDKPVKISSRAKKKAVKKSKKPSVALKVLKQPTAVDSTKPFFTAQTNAIQKATLDKNNSAAVPQPSGFNFNSPNLGSLLPKSFTQQKSSVRSAHVTSPFVVNLKNPNTAKYTRLDPEPTQRKTVPTARRKVSLVQKNRVEVNLLHHPDMYQLTVVKIFSLLVWPLVALRQVLKKKRLITPVVPVVAAIEYSDEVEDVFAPPTKKSRRAFTLSPNLLMRPIASFVLAAFVFVLPLQAMTYYQQLQETKDSVLLLTADAVALLKTAQQSATEFDLAGARDNFTKAEQQFSLARQQIDGINSVIAEVLTLVPGLNRSVETGVTLLESGQLLSQVGQLLSQAGQSFLNTNSQDYFEALKNLNQDFHLAIETYNQAEEKFLSITIDDVPEAHRQAFLNVVKSLPQVKQQLLELYQFNEILLTLLGRDQWQRYLIVFTNNNEMRAVGGFMGSFALIDIDRGKIKKIEIPAGGTYDVQGQLVPRVISPEPLHLINPRWEFQDANWWPDFPTTAKKIQWFYTNAGGPSTDGVIVMTATLMSRIIDAVGPLTVDGYDQPITGENFVSVTQSVIKVERDKQSSTPKQFLTDLGPVVIERLFNAEGDQLRQLIEVLRQGLNEKHLVLYFTDRTAQRLVTDLDWAGSLKATQGDFLSVVHSNLAGGKTDEVIDQKITHQATIESDGSIVNSVTITRTHAGTPGVDVFTGVQNNSYVRFYVPSGSVLMSATGFQRPAEQYFDQPGEDLQADLDLLSLETGRQRDEASGTDVYQESGKTVFGNWLQLKPGETKAASITYRLPFKVSTTGNEATFYSLLVQKQIGDRQTALDSRLTLKNGMEVLATFPGSVAVADSALLFSQPLTTDAFYGVAIKNQ